MQRFGSLLDELEDLGLSQVSASGDVTDCAFMAEHVAHDLGIAVELRWWDVEPTKDALLPVRAYRTHRTAQHRLTEGFPCLRSVAQVRGTDDFPVPPARHLLEESICQERPVSGPELIVGMN